MDNIWEGLEIYDFHYPPPVDENEEVLRWGIEQMQNASDFDLSILPTDFRSDDLWELFPIPLGTGDTPKLAHKEIEGYDSVPYGLDVQDVPNSNEAIHSGDAPYNSKEGSDNANNNTTSPTSQHSLSTRKAFDDITIHRTFASPPNSPTSSDLSSPPNSPLIPPTPPSLSPSPVPVSPPVSPNHNRLGGKSIEMVKELQTQHSRRVSYNIAHRRPLHELMPEEEKRDAAHDKRMEKRRLSEEASLRKQAKEAEKRRQDLREREVIEIDSDEEMAVVPEFMTAKKSSMKSNGAAPDQVSSVKRKAVKQPKRKFDNRNDYDDDDFMEPDESEGDDGDDGDDLYAPSKKARRQEMKREAKRRPAPKKRKVVSASTVAGSPKVPTTVDRHQPVKSKEKVKPTKERRRPQKRKNLSLFEKTLEIEQKAIEKHRCDNMKKVERTAIEKAVRSAIRNRPHHVPEEELPILPSVDEEDLYMDTTDWDTDSDSESLIKVLNKPQVDFIYCHYPQFGKGRRAWIPSLEKVTDLVLEQVPEPKSLFLSFCLKNGVFDICPETGTTYEKERERRFRVLELLEEKGFVPNLRTFEVHPSKPKANS